MKILKVDKCGVYENISEDDMKHVARIVQKNLLPCSSNIDMNRTAFHSTKDNVMNVDESSFV